MRLRAQRRGAAAAGALLLALLAAAALCAPAAAQAAAPGPASSNGGASAAIAAANETTSGSASSPPALLPPAPAPAAAPVSLGAPVSSFVQRAGTRFVVAAGGASHGNESAASTDACETFNFVGWNTFYLMLRAADPASRCEVLEVLDKAQALGLTVLRTWAFSDGPGQWRALQRAPGVYDENTFAGLDFVIHQARAHAQSAGALRAFSCVFLRFLCGLQRSACVGRAEISHALRARMCVIAAAARRRRCAASACCWRSATTGSTTAAWTRRVCASTRTRARGKCTCVE
jgi:hypothetical protein